MSFDLKNAPMVFQHLKDPVPGVYRFPFAIAYLDDIIICSTNQEDHTKHIMLILEKLRYANLSIKLSKCEWVLSQMEYLGFITSFDGIKGNPEKIKTYHSLSCSKEL